jgi:hypothetical protein
MSPSGALNRLEIRVERLNLTIRFTYAFHAREVRFERDDGNGYERIFPETFSFHASRHDPAELYLQLEDLATKPRLISPNANRRDADVLFSRMALGIPRYLDALLTRLEEEGRLGDAALTRSYEDLALLVQTLLRFLSSKGLNDRPGMQMAFFHLRKLSFRALLSLVERRVTPQYLADYVAGTVDPIDPGDDLSEAGFFYTMESGESEAVNRCLMRLAERAFYRWVEDICLDESNRAFEVEDSPFDDRETEVRRAIGKGGRHWVQRGRDWVQRGRDLSPFIRRPGNRDCLRVLEKLAAWFLRQYDVHYAAVMIHHADQIGGGTPSPERVLSRHTTANYVGALLLISSPFLAAIFAYDRAPLFFDAACAAELIVADAAVLWFLLYRFCWKRNLTFFHAAVPRIAAGIIVGYLPIFFIDEVWALAAQSWVLLFSVALLMGFMTLLYLYIEVEGRLGDAALAFARARQIFFLGVFQAFGIGLVITGLVGDVMVLRAWGGGAVADLHALSQSVPHFIGQLPRIVGFEPFYTFPPAVFVMTFLSFFIGTFLQLLWEDIPITEPL